MVIDSKVDSKLTDAVTFTKCSACFSLHQTKPKIKYFELMYDVNTTLV